MWVKIDDGFYDNGKVIAVGRDARALYLAALCYANKNGTRGFVPEYMIGQLAAKAEADKPQQAVERLCAVFAPNRSSLWTRTEGGFTIHDEPRHQFEPLVQEIRKTQDYKDWREAVMIRDSYTCRRCGAAEGELHAHHIREFALYPEGRLDPMNGMTLCVACHEFMHGRKLR